MIKKILFVAVMGFITYQIGAWNALRPGRELLARWDRAEEARQAEMDRMWAEFLEVPKDYRAPATATIATAETVLGEHLTATQLALFADEIGPRMNWIAENNGPISHRIAWRFWPAVIEKLDDM